MNQLPITEVDGRWQVPDAREFVANTGWRNGKFVVAETITGVLEFNTRIEAVREAAALVNLIHAARRLESA